MIEDSVANAGYVITGSGAGGSGGNYVFANLAELNDIIAEWIALRDRTFARSETLAQAKGLVVPPAKDPMSHEHAEVLRLSLDKAIEHNYAMLYYADGYVSKLTASRDQYATTDIEHAAWYRSTGPG